MSSQPQSDSYIRKFISNFLLLTQNEIFLPTKAINIIINREDK